MGGPMQVLMVTTSFPRHEGDHAGHFVAALAQGIAANGHNVTVLAPHEGVLPDRESVEGVQVRRFRYMPGWAEKVAYGDGIVVNLRRKPMAVLGLPAFVVSLRRQLRQLAAGADLIHVHWAPTAVLAAAGQLSKPYVLTLHGSDVTLAHRGGLWLRVLGRALKGAAGVDVVAEAQRTFLLESGLWDDSRPLAVIPSGIPDELIERPVRSAIEGPFKFVYVGRLVESKGVADLLEAFVSVRAAGIDASLTLVGSGPLEPVIRQKAARAGLADSVVLCGQLPHEGALDTIASASALVLPSYGEGSPLVVAEALSLGIPVIGTRVGAIPELLGEEGLIVEPGDVTGLAECMRRLASDPGLAERLATEGRVHASTNLTWSAITASTIAFYGDVLAAQGAAKECG